MNGLELAKELSLLGAESTVAAPADGVIDTHEGFSLYPNRWKALGDRMRAHLRRGGPVERRLREQLGLSELSYWLVALCAAVEIYPEAAAAISLIAEDDRLHLVSPIGYARLMRAALGVTFVEALGEAIAGGPAERLGLVERADALHGKPLAQQPLRLSAIELRAQLTAEPAEQMTSLNIRREQPAAGLGFAPSMVAGAAALLREWGVVCIRCPAARTGRQLAIDLATHLGRDALLVTAGDDNPDAAEVIKLRGGLPVLDLFGPCNAKGFADAYVRHVARHLASLVVIVPWNAATGDFATVDIEAIDLETRRRIWALGVGNGQSTESLAMRFRVSLEEVRSAVKAARDAAYVQQRSADEPDPDAIAAQIMAQGSRRMGRMVTRLRSSARLEHLIIPAPLRQQLEDVASWYRATARVYHEWRIADRSSLGRGLTCLFSGLPGTGKTFAAQCLAGALGLNLYRIDLSQVVSKYIGETEKALFKIFEEAEAGHGILLFDEADALFGKRSEVKDAHDRYANVEVGYLLQRFEAFEGISILTTNLRNNIDAAFTRRLRFIIDFPMPDAPTRRRLWEQSLPPQKHWDRTIDLTIFIERFPLSGGHIHNIGIAAAHLAAACPDGMLRVDHLVRATYRELEKNGMARSREDFGQLAVHLPGRS
jgi:hypothetical protein